MTVQCPSDVMLKITAKKLNGGSTQEIKFITNTRVKAKIPLLVSRHQSVVNKKSFLQIWKFIAKRHRIHNKNQADNCD